MNMKPIFDRILVKVEEHNPFSNSSIYVSYARELPPSRIGTVVSVGPGRWDDHGNRVPMKLKAGDKCIFTYLGGIEISEGYRMYAESEALGIIEDGN